MAPALVQQYVATPMALLDPSPGGGTEALRMAVQRLTPTGPEAITAVLSIVGAASRLQQLAIGTGLGAAAGACLAQDSAIVQRIKNAVRSSGNQVVEQSFTAAFEGDAGNDATERVLNSVETHRLAAGLDRRAPQSLLPDAPTSAGKLPNPFGPPDEWR